VTTLVKICGLCDQKAVQAAVAAGADAVGFVFFDKSPRNITPEKAARLAAGVPANVRRVAVMLHPDSALWDEVSDVLRPDVLQTDRDDFSSLNVAEHIEKWPVLREGAVSAGDMLPDTFVYEGTRSGQGQAVDWNAAAAIARRGRMILAGGLTTENVANAIGKVAPYGVDASSALESAPGEKDVAKIAAFVAAAKAADRN
jgi:phosphoribosylanthranilate isomerase